MRSALAGGAVLAAVAVLGAVMWWSRSGATPIAGGPAGAGQAAGTGETADRGTGGSITPITGGEVKPDPKPDVDPETARVQGETVSQFSDLVKDTREDHTFHHCVLGRDIPDDIAAETGMTNAERTVAGNVLRGEPARIAAALREFVKSLTDFEPADEEVARADGYTLIQMVTKHQPLFLEMAPFFQNMDDDTQRAFYEERRPWSDFFQDDTIVIRLCKVMHAVRAETYQQMREGGVDADTLDKLRARYLLPGHFRFPNKNRFEFGPPLR